MNAEAERKVLEVLLAMVRAARVTNQANRELTEALMRRERALQAELDEVLAMLSSASPSVKPREEGGV